MRLPILTLSIPINSSITKRLMTIINYTTNIFNPVINYANVRTLSIFCFTRDVNGDKNIDKYLLSTYVLH